MEIFDILTKPITTEQIDELRKSSNMKLAKFKKYDHIVATIGGIICLISAIMLFYHHDGSAVAIIASILISISLICIFYNTLWEAGDFFATIAGIAMALILTTISHSGMLAGIINIIVSLIGMCLIYLFITQKIEEADKTLYDLQPIGASHCPFVVDACEKDLTISEYHKAVLEQPRILTEDEYWTIRRWVNNDDTRKIERDNQAAIDRLNHPIKFKGIGIISN